MRPIRPLDEHGAIGSHEFLPAQVRQVFWSRHTVQIDVVDRSCGCRILTNQRERGTQNGLSHASTAARGSHESRLAGSQRPEQSHKEPVVHRGPT